MSTVHCKDCNEDIISGLVFCRKCTKELLKDKERMDFLSEQRFSFINDSINRKNYREIVDSLINRKKNEKESTKTTS